METIFNTAAVDNVDDDYHDHGYGDDADDADDDEDDDADDDDGDDGGDDDDDDDDGHILHQPSSQTGPTDESHRRTTCWCHHAQPP